MLIRIAVPDLGQVPLAATRALVAALTLLPLMLLQGLWPEFRRHWRHLLIIGLISTALPFSFMSLSTQHTSAAFGSILNALTPIFSALIAWLWLREGLTVAALIGIVLSFAGVVVMMLDRETLSTAIPFWPIMAGLAAALFYGVTGNYTRRYAQHFPVLLVAAGSQLFSALFLLPVAWALWPTTPVSTVSWLAVVILGVLCTGVAYILFFNLLGKVGVARTVIVTYLVPVFAMAWGYAVLGEQVTLKMLAGATCILAGIGLTTYRHKANKA